MVYANPSGFLEGSNAFSVAIHVYLCFYHEVFFLKEKKRETETLAHNRVVLVWFLRFKAYSSA